MVNGIPLAVDLILHVGTVVSWALERGPLCMAVRGDLRVYPGW